MPEIKTAEVVFRRRGRSLTWTPADGFLLDLAQASGLNPPWSCREGVCQSCWTRLLEGAVEHPPDLLVPPRDHEVLLCCARPLTEKVVLDG